MEYTTENIISVAMARQARMEKADLELHAKRNMLYGLMDELLQVDGEHIKVDVTFTSEVVTDAPVSLSGVPVVLCNGDTVIRMTARTGGEDGE